MCAQVDPNNSNLAAAISWNGKFRVLDTRSRDTNIFDVDLKKSSSAMKEFLQLCWSPDSGHIALSNRQDRLYLLDLRRPGNLTLGATKASSLEINAMTWSASGDALWLAAGGMPGRVQVYPAPSLQEDEMASLVAHQSATISLAADPTGQYMASGGADCLVNLWDPRHLVCMRSMPYATQAVTTMSFNHTGTLLAWGTGNAGSTSTGERNLTIVGAHTGALYWQDITPAPVLQVKWHSKRNVLAYTLNPAQLADDRDNQRGHNSHNSRDSRSNSAVVHMLKIPESES